MTYKIKPCENCGCVEFELYDGELYCLSCGSHISVLEEQMLKAKIYLDSELLTEMSNDDWDPLLYEVANWCDQKIHINKNDKLVIEVTQEKGEINYVLYIQTK